MPTILDVSQGEQRVNVDALLSSLNAARRFAGRRIAVPDARHDAEWTVDADGLDAWHRHVDGLVIREAQRQYGQGWALPRHTLEVLGQRHDTGLASNAGGFPRQFEFIRSQMFEEARQPLTAMQYFPADTSVPLGARKHTARRALGAGEAQIYRAGSELPRARTTYAEEQFGVAYVVCAVDVQYFDALTTDWAGLQQYQRDLRLAIRLVEERINRIEWGGDVGSQIAGVLNYPTLSKIVIATVFDDASDPEDVTAALTDLATTPQTESGGTFTPTAMLVSPEINAFITTRKHSGTGGTDTTIAEYFLRGQSTGGATGIRSIQVAPELAGIGPNGEDGILCYRPELTTVGRVAIQDPVTLPVFQASPLDQTTVVFGATGGMVCPDVGNMILGYAALS